MIKNILQECDKLYKEVQKYEAIANKIDYNRTDLSLMKGAYEQYMHQCELMVIEINNSPDFSGNNSDFENYFIREIKICKETINEINCAMAVKITRERWGIA